MAPFATTSDRREMAEIVRSTYIPKLHIVPGHLELMEFEHETPKALIARARGDLTVFREDRRSAGTSQRCL